MTQPLFADYGHEVKPFISHVETDDYMMLQGQDVFQEEKSDSAYQSMMYDIIAWKESMASHQYMTKDHKATLRMDYSQLRTLFALLSSIPLPQ